MNKQKWWLILLIALTALIIGAGLLTKYVANKADDAAVSALSSEGISGVSYAGLNGFQELGSDGLDIVLEGPANLETAAVSAVKSRNEIDDVKYVVTNATASIPVNEISANISSSGEVTLTGKVKGSSAKNSIIASAEAEYGANNIIDQLEIDSAVADNAGQLVIDGESISAAEQTAWVAKAAEVATIGNLELVDNTTVKQTADSLNDLFELNPIEFDVNLATIRSSSIPTLVQAAATINANPESGDFLVVGHTDSDGSAVSNFALSEARANAVVNYLIQNEDVDADRLEAEGRGETELLVTPETSPQDKQDNRRIEWILK